MHSSPFEKYTFSLPICALCSLLLLSSCSGDTTPFTPSSTVPTTPISDAPLSITNNQTRTISRDVTYRTPKGNITSTFVVELDDTDTIERVTATTDSYDHHDREFHTRFNQGAKNTVVGKKITELSLSAIGGASLTTDAFVQAMSRF